MPLISVTLFGGLQVAVDDRPVTLPYDKVRALLACLIVESPRPQRRETLVGLLWPGQTERQARHSLSQALLKLRRAVDPTNQLILADRHSIGLNPDAALDVDTIAFTTHLQQCQTHRHAQPALCAICMQRWEAAALLYEGVFLEGLSLADAPGFEQWLAQRQAQYHHQALDLLGELCIYYEQRGELKQAVGTVRRLLTLEPWHEASHYQLMRLLLYTGQRSAAIAQYHACAELLLEELGVEPSPRTQALFRVMKTADPHPPHNLPTASTQLVGRRQEIAQLMGWLAGKNRRLITIMGPGGMGKSRLALGVAYRQLGRPTIGLAEAETYAFYGDGVFWVTLAGLKSTMALVPAIADAIGLQFESSTGGYGPRSPRRQLLDYLREKRILLILDNFEQLLDPEDAAASTGLIHALMQNAPNAQILVTSRERLQLHGEQLLWLHGLSYPQVDDEEEIAAHASVSLFIQSAQRLRPQLGKDEADLPLIGAICRFLKGTPLAIELAANAVHVLSLDDILVSLQESLALLKTDNRHVADRHRSMEAAFVTSWNRLPAVAQHTYARLSVFQDGFSGSAAQRIAQAKPAQLSLLINHSLLQFDPQTRRYRLHDLLRQMVQEKWVQLEGDDQKTIRAEHAAYYLHFLTDQETELRGAGQVAALRQLDVEAENCRLAWLWACGHQPAMLLSAIHPLCQFYDRRGRYKEGADACRHALNSLNASAIPNAEVWQIRGRLNAWYGRFLLVSGQWELSQQALDKSLAHLQSPACGADRAFALLQQSRRVWRVDRERAQQLAHESLSLARQEAEPWAQSDSLNLLGRMARAKGMFAESHAYLSESLALRQSIADQRGIAHTLSHLSLLTMDLGYFEQAYRHAQKSLSLFREMGDDLNVANAANSLGLICGFSGQFRESGNHFAMSEAIFRRLGMPLAANMTQEWLSFSAMMRHGNYETSVESQLTIYETFSRAQSRRGMAYASLGLAFGYIGARQSDEAARFAQQGMQLFAQLEQTKEAAECSGLLAIAAESGRCVQEARRHFDAYAEFLVETATFFPTVIALALTVLVKLEKGRVEEAVAFHAMLLELPFVDKGCWFYDVIGRNVEDAARVLPSETAARAEARGRRLDFRKEAVSLFRHHRL